MDKKPNVFCTHNSNIFDMLESPEQLDKRRSGICKMNHYIGA